MGVGPMAIVAARTCKKSQLKRKMKCNTHRFIKTSVRVQVLHWLEHKTQNVLHYTVLFINLWPTKQKHKIVHSLQRLFLRILPFLPLNYRVEMSSIFIHAPFSSSSMKCTYPPSCNKPSKQKLKHGHCNPTQNKRTHPFVLHSSSPSLHLGRRCRHCGSLHSRVSCV